MVYHSSVKKEYCCLCNFLHPCEAQTGRVHQRLPVEYINTILTAVPPSSLCLPGHTGRFIRAVFCTSLLFVLGHICFQTVLYTYPPLNLAIGDNCSQWDTISRHIGMSRYVSRAIYVYCHSLVGL